MFNNKGFLAVKIFLEKVSASTWPFFQIRGMKTVTAKKLNPTEKYHFAQPTKSSRAKKMAVEKSPEGKTSSRSKSGETKPMNKKVRFYFVSFFYFEY